MNILDDRIGIQETIAAVQRFMDRLRKVRHMTPGWHRGGAVIGPRKRSVLRKLRLKIARRVA